MDRVVLKKESKMCLSKLFKAKAVETIPVKTSEFFGNFLQSQIAGNDVFNLVKDAKEHVYIWDSTYWAVSMEDWRTIFADVLKSMHSYIAERFDCEDFAFACMVRITEKYGLNTCAVVEGTSPGGEHGFNVFISVDNEVATRHILEPQTGEIDPQGYVMKTVIFS